MRYILVNTSLDEMSIIQNCSVTPNQIQGELLELLNSPKHFCC